MSTKIDSFTSIAWNVTLGAKNHPMQLPSQHSFTYNNYDKIFNEDEFVIEVMKSV